MKNGVLDVICANITVRSLIPARVTWRLRLKERKFTRISMSRVRKSIVCGFLRHCEDPICVKSCIAGALSKKDGVICVDKNKCVGCLTCVLVCPYGALAPGEDGVMNKCELCLQNACGEPACVKGCPNNAIVYEQR